MTLISSFDLLTIGQKYEGCNDLDGNSTQQPFIPTRESTRQEFEDWLLPQMPEGTILLRAPYYYEVQTD